MVLRGKTEANSCVRTRCDAHSVTGTRRSCRHYWCQAEVHMSLTAPSYMTISAVTDENARQNCNATQKTSGLFQMMSQKHALLC